jgi:hypothetical protein
MRMLTLCATLALLGALATPTVAAAQRTAAAVAIDSGMTREQVIERFGRPATERTRDDITYLFFANGRERVVGMSDLVILEAGRVVDAILRHPARTYTGTSSSPTAISARDAVRRRPTSVGTTTIPPVSP